jgi:hypothetical protein
VRVTPSEAKVFGVVQGRRSAGIVETTMTDRSYVVNFLKTVTTDYGRDAEICQRTITVRAANPEEAAGEAIRQFCTLENVPNWLEHADRYVVQEAEFPS